MTGVEAGRVEASAAAMCSARSFSIEDQRWFAVASGDANPLHVDPDFAARTYPGFPVVHGLHLVLWTLDAVARGGRGGPPPPGLKVNFLRPVIVGDEAMLDLTHPGSVRIRVRGEVMLIVKLAAGRAPGTWSDETSPRAPSTPPVDRRSGEMLEHVAGVLALPDDEAQLSAAFPDAAAWLGARALRGLAGVSTIVGMESPGLYSVMSELSVTFGQEDGRDGLAFRTLSYRPVFNRVELAFHGSGLIGKVAALAGRADPADGCAIATTQVRQREFAGGRPLIVGASSGLGAMTAILLAAGGARPILTYTRAPETLDATTAAIARAGGAWEAIRLDVTIPNTLGDALGEIGWDGAEVYYFASPRIFRRRVELFQEIDYGDFARIYVAGFYEIARRLIAYRDGRPLRILYPSTSAIDEALPELLEYALAKAAGEKLCAALQAANPAVSIDAPRLGRIATRQTTTSMAVEADDAAMVMLPLIRRMQG